MITTVRKLSVLLLLQFCFAQAVAFDFDGTKWIGAETEFYVELDGLSATGISWTTAFIQAMDEWSSETSFNFVLREEFKSPCLDDGFNGVEFTDDICGTEFGENTLAVTTRKFRQQLLGPPSIEEADIVVNQTSPLDIFDGNLVQFGPLFGRLDFRRIALHELGHVIGLDHEADAPAIMAANIGNLDRLQADDITGVEALYGGLSNCHIRELTFGQFSNGLEQGDCTVQELTLGGGDTSFVDIYSFELSTTASLEFTMTSSSLDSVLILADSELNYLEFDDKSADICNSSLSVNLAAGSYLLLANTYDEPPREECGVTGAYSLTTSITSDTPQLLGSSTSLNGASSAAQFSGGISADNGVSFGNSFSPDDSLDISASIAIDPQHQGLAGFLIVAAVLDGQILLLNEQGQFVDAGLNPFPLTRAANKTLGAIEELSIATDLVAADLGIQQIEVDFVLGYGLASDPDEVYFHQVPLNLTIAP